LKPIFKDEVLNSCVFTLKTFIIIFVQPFKKSYHFWLPGIEDKQSSLLQRFWLRFTEHSFTGLAGLTASSSGNISQWFGFETAFRKSAHQHDFFCTLAAIKTLYRHCHAATLSQEYCFFADVEPSDKAILDPWS